MDDLFESGLIKGHDGGWSLHDYPMGQGGIILQHNFYSKCWCWPEWVVDDYGNIHWIHSWNDMMVSIEN